MHGSGREGGNLPDYKVTFLIASLTRGGTENQVAGLAVRLKRRGWRVSIITLRPPVGPGVFDALATESIEVQSPAASSKRGGGRGRGLGRILRDKRPDVVVAFGLRANMLARGYGRVHRIPAVITSTRGDAIGAGWRRGTEWLMSRLPVEDRIVFNSDVVGRRMVDQGLVNRRRYRVIPNGIDVESFKAHSARMDIREALEVGPDDFLWLCVGNLRPEKDHPTLLRAFAALRERDQRAQLRLAGGGRPSAELLQLLERPGVRACVGLLGNRDDIPDLLSASDGFVLSSRNEGLPNVIMEAFAMARPVISTDVGGVSELVVHGESGFLAPAASPDRLAEEMLRLMELPPDRREAFGAAGRRHIVESFDLEAITDLWESLFLEVIAEKDR